MTGPGAGPFTQSRRLTADFALGPPSPAWRAVAASRPVVLVGLSGVGKTTLAQSLSDLGLTALPDRRRLTDLAILPLTAAGPVADLDRAARFAATARFREIAPGGMADVLAALSVAPDFAASSAGLLFDGLRGAAEVAAFAKAAPGARFVMLDAPETLRIARIAGRADAFDRIGAAAPPSAGARAAELTPAAATSDDPAVARAARIVREEAAHYDPEAAAAALRAGARGRSAIIDAAAPAAAVLAEARRFLGL